MTGRTTVNEATLQEFKTGLRGELLRPGDDGFDAARRVWNGMIDRTPAFIVRCAGVADVRRAVAFAREQELLVAVRGGGHNVAGNAVCDGGLVIDMSRMKGIRVDPAARTARAQAGATWGDFDHETAAFGLAVTGGHVSTTGIAGLTLGGGIGWLMRKHGSPATTCSPRTSSPPMGSFSPPARARTTTSSGACAAGAATSAS
jgi:FAD binding domain